MYPLSPDLLPGSSLFLLPGGSQSLPKVAALFACLNGGFENKTIHLFYSIVR